VHVVVYGTAEGIETDPERAELSADEQQRRACASHLTEGADP
jgi:hypothetical protein